MAATATIPSVPNPQRGLTEAEASRRLAARGPLAKQASSRSYASIVRANVLTIFNLILAVAGAVTIAFGAWQDALFLGILFFNTAIGIVQEVRAKRALDQLAALVAPTATVVRDGATRQVSVDNVVVGDALRIQAGRPDRRRRTHPHRFGPVDRRIDSDGRVAARGARTGRRSPLRFVRGRRDRRVSR